MRRLLLLVLGLMVSLTLVGRTTPAYAQTELDQERITRFDATIVVNSDTSLLVTETLTVHSLGEKIRHGIYRDFPTSYRAKSGSRQTVGFRLLDVERDGQSEPYHTAALANGQRIYLGDAQISLAPGDYVYRLRYTTNRQLGFYSDHDELYWNVTGQDWQFPIDSARATVRLPASIPTSQVTTTSYTGLAGSQTTSATETANGETIVFENETQLEPGEGLTIVVGWPKGYLTPPTRCQLAIWWLSDNRGFVISLLILFLIFCCYFRVWQRFGRDPKRGTIIPQYEPPKDFTQAMLRALERRSFDATSFAATVVSLAVRGLVTINEPKKHDYLLTRTPQKSTGLSDDESAVLKLLFAKSGTQLELTRTYNPTIETVRANLAIQLAGTVINQYYLFNWRPIMLGSFVSVLGFVMTRLPFFPPLTGLQTSLFIAGLILVNLVFFSILPRYTTEGRQLLDHLEGFRWFLRVTEQDRLNFFHPPDRTVALFEKYLPYAIALGVANQWAKQFTTVFTQLAAQGTPYLPLWYAGTSWDLAHAADFGGALSTSLGSVMTAAGTAPGSSSGFGGGGSGGGGGGGGGGGW